MQVVLVKGLDQVIQKLSRYRYTVGQLMLVKRNRLGVLGAKI